MIQINDHDNNNNMSLPVMFMYISTADINRFLGTRKHLHAFRKPNCMAKYAMVMTASPTAAFNVSACLYRIENTTKTRRL